MSNMVVRTNVFSLNAHRNMKNVGLEQGRASNRLSSGYRINSAADDAAGLAISETMRAQIRGLDQASRNAQDGQAMLLTTEGGLEEIGNMLQRTRELLVQASNDTNTQDQRTMIEQEISQLAQEISSMQQRVEFNTNRVLAMGPAMDSGIAGEMALIQQDMNTLSDQFATANAALDSVAVAREILSALPPLAGVDTLNAGQMRSLNEALAGVTFAAGAPLQSTGMSNVDLLSADARNAVLNAATVGGNMTDMISALDQRRNDIQAVVTELNDHVGTLHNNAQNTFGNISDFAAFRNVAASQLGASAARESSGSWSFEPLPGATAWVAGGTAPGAPSATVNVPSDVTVGATVGNTASFNHYIWSVDMIRVTGGDIVLTTAVREVGTAGEAVTADGGRWIGGAVGSTVWTWESIQVLDVATPGLAPTTPGASNGATHGAFEPGTGVTVGTWTWNETPAVAEIAGTATGGMGAGSTGNNVAFFQVGANANQGITFDFETVSRAVTAAASNVTMVATLISNPDAGSGIGRGISVTPLINQIQESLDDINTIRANLGAVQNRMDFTMRSLDISSENLQNSESRVRDADIAREMMRFTMSNVLQQASISMLSQANQMPNNLLQILR